MSLLKKKCNKKAKKLNVKNKRLKRRKTTLVTTCHILKILNFETPRKI